jgi:dipeptidyl aminopeptidase/acylaminoacyl peptidase
VAQCSICHTEYTENTVNFCPTCGWDLTPDSFPEQVLEAISHKERIRTTWARGMWSWASEMRLQLQQATQEQNLIQSQLSQVLEQTSTERLLEIFATVSPSAKQLIELNTELQQTQYKISQLKAQLHEAQSQIGTDGLDLLIQAMKADQSETVQRVALLLLRRSAAPKAIEALEEFKPNSYKLLSSLPYGAHKDCVKSVAISPDGQTLASGSGDKDKTIKLWDASTGELIRTLEGHEGWVSSVAFSPDGQILASGSGDTSIRLWDFKTGVQIGYLPGHTNGIYCVAFSPDNQTLATGGGDKSIRLWNFKTGELTSTFAGFAGAVSSVAISSSGHVLAGSSEDKTIRIWNLGTKELLHQLTGHTNLVLSVAISPDGQHLVSASQDNTIRIWRLATGELLHTIAVFKYVRTLRAEEQIPSPRVN